MDLQAFVQHETLRNIYAAENTHPLRFTDNAILCTNIEHSVLTYNDTINHSV